MKAGARPSRPALGIIGLGAFGTLAVRHLAPYFEIRAYDPAYRGGAEVAMAPLAAVAACPIVLLAVPVSELGAAIAAMAPHLRPGALVLDVGSVKIAPATIMLERLPAHVDILATHPLFGPQSARDGVAGHKIVLCPLRGRRTARVAAFLRHVLALDVIRTSPEEHDREAALAQGVTRLIARILFRMERLPDRITTRSFELIREAIEMVRDDAPGVVDAIEQANPHAGAVRRAFFDHARAIEEEGAASAQSAGACHQSCRQPVTSAIARPLVSVAGR
ncbi:prephenate dehydrogenase [Sphingomonas zeicaulis]|uniref:prephenate dehydrogenase/arogenate dehydrogenase family protein n=1 Tax=Sphingomonas zeicaulis TaxID=1632740 RepID=UPI003D227DEA